MDPHSAVLLLGGAARRAELITHGVTRGALDAACAETWCGAREVSYACQAARATPRRWPCG